MSGWIALLLLGVVSLALLRAFGRPERASVLVIAAALCAAAAGYAWQGQPGLPGAPAADRRQAGLRGDTAFAVERPRLLPSYGESAQWLVFADGLNRAGEDQAAVSALGGAVRRFPRDVALRLGFAHALLVLADFTYTPAVDLAYARAIALAPAGDPAPRFFRGLAHLEARDLDGAEREWVALRATLPAASPWRGVLDERLTMLALVRRMARG